MSFSGNIDSDNSSVTVRLGGRLDLTTNKRLGRLVEEALAAGGSEIVLDFDRVDHLGSGAIRILIDLVKRVGTRQIVIRQAHGMALEAVRMTGLDCWLKVEEKVESEPAPPEVPKRAARRDA